MLVESPRRAAPIVHRRPAHIPSVLALETAPRGAVHHACVVPEDQVAVVLPLHAEHVLGLRGVPVQLLEQLLRLLRVQSLDVVHVRRDVQVHPVGGLVALYQVVSAHRVVFRVDVGEGLGRGLLAGVPEGVRGDVVALEELLLQVLGQFFERRAGVGVFGVAACALGWQFVRAEEGVSCPAGVEAGVDVEELVALYIHR